jgi:hypothetical protein
MCCDMRETVVIKIKLGKMENSMTIALNAFICSRYLKNRWLIIYEMRMYGEVFKSNH